MERREEGKRERERKKEKPVEKKTSNLINSLKSRKFLGDQEPFLNWFGGGL